MTELIPPRIEGTVIVGGKRRLGFAEFGPVDGTPLVWLHGTPGARRQIPQEARIAAHDLSLRIVGIDRPGIGSSTAHRYGSIAEFAEDLEMVAEDLGLERMVVVGLSGGGPYALGAGAMLGDRVMAVGVLGGVAPTVGEDAIAGGLVAFGSRFAPLIGPLHRPLSMGMSLGVRLIKPLVSPALDLYARFSPEADRKLLGRPEFKAMFIDDLVHGSRRQLAAPLADLLLFSRDWGFRLADVRMPVRWWHGDLDNIVPFSHGEHCVARLPDAQLFTLPGQSHLGSLGEAELIMTTLLKAAGQLPA